MPNGTAEETLDLGELNVELLAKTTQKSAVEVEGEAGGDKKMTDKLTVNKIFLPVRFITSDNTGSVERYHWRLNLTKSVRLSWQSFKIEEDSIRGYWGSTDGTLTSPEDGTNVDYQLIVSKEGDKLDYLMRESQSHEGLDGYDDAATSARKVIAQPECDQIRTYILKEPVGLSEKYLPLWKRDFIKDGSVIKTLMYAVRIAGEKEENPPIPTVPTIKDIKDNTEDMIEVEKPAVEVEGETITRMYDIHGTVVDPTPFEEMFAKLEAVESQKEFDQMLKGGMQIPPRPVANAVVTLRGESVTREAITDSQGKFQFTGLTGPTFGPYGGMMKSETYEISAEMPARPYKTGRGRVAVAKEKVTLDADRDVTLELRADFLSQLHRHRRGNPRRMHRAPLRRNRQRGRPNRRPRRRNRRPR